jgi:hypothetical protein
VGEHDLLVRAQQPDRADVAQEQVERVGRVATTVPSLVRLVASVHRTRR